MVRIAGTNDVHCALLASGQCIGIGFVPFLLSVLSLFYFIPLGLENLVVPGEELLGVGRSWDQLQSILHSHDTACIWAIAHHY